MSGEYMVDVERDHSFRSASLSLVTHDVYILGLPFWNPSYEAFAEWWDGILAGDRTRAVVLGLVNAHTLNESTANPKFRKALEAADVLVNDGIGYRVASKMRGVPTKYNLNGTDLIPRLFSELKQPIRVFLYGAVEEANRGAAEELARYENVTIVGRVNGYVDAETEAVPMIKAAAPDVVLVALGHPKQEIFCVEHRLTLGAKILIPCGGLFDFLSRKKSRAPSWMRASGLEWLYRLSLEPSRLFARYVLGNPLFLWRSFVYASRDRALAKRK